jgi:hypothetical protein
MKSNNMRKKMIIKLGTFRRKEENNFKGKK